jgi:hypothetical protein
MPQRQSAPSFMIAQASNSEGRGTMRSSENAIDQWSMVMNLAKNVVVGAAVAAVISVTHVGGVRAAEASSALKTLRPISGQGTAGNGQQFLLNVEVGGKQAVSYFLNEQGLCKLTLMVAEAFNGEDVPNLTTVRFETAVDPGRSANFTTAEGKSLEFTCQAGALAMSVAAPELVAIRKSGM